MKTFYNVKLNSPRMSLGHFTVWYSIFKITQTIININVSKGRSQNFYVRLRGTMEIKVGPHQYSLVSGTSLLGRGWTHFHSTIGKVIILQCLYIGIFGRQEDCFLDLVCSLGQTYVDVFVNVSSDSQPYGLLISYE